MRQIMELLAVGRQGDLVRAIALIREHLVDFPGDHVARGAVAWLVSNSGDEALISEVEDLLPAAIAPAAMAG